MFGMLCAPSPRFLLHLFLFMSSSFSLFYRTLLFPVSSNPFPASSIFFRLSNTFISFSSLIYPYPPLPSPFHPFLYVLYDPSLPPPSPIPLLLFLILHFLLFFLFLLIHFFLLHFLLSFIRLVSPNHCIFYFPLLLVLLQVFPFSIFLCLFLVPDPVTNFLPTKCRNYFHLVGQWAEKPPGSIL